MSRRRGEFEHRTSIFEGAFRAWSHLGGLDPQELESKTPADLDPLSFPLEDDPRLKDAKIGSAHENSDGSRRRFYPYEPLPRSGLAHPYVQAILSPWLGPDADHDAIQLGLTTLRTWWQHRRKGESGSAVAALGTDKMNGVVEGYTRHFFNLAHCLVVNDNEQPPRTLFSKMKELEKVRNKRNRKRAREEEATKLAALMTAGIENGFHDSGASAATTIMANPPLVAPTGDESNMSPLERLAAAQRRQLAEVGGVQTSVGQPNDINSVPLVNVKGKCVPGKLDLRGVVDQVSHHASQLAHRGTSGGPATVTSGGQPAANYGDPNTTPVVFVSENGDIQIAMTVDGITCAHCVKIVETVLRGCNGNKSPIDGLLDAAADRVLCSVLLKIDQSGNAKRIAFEAARNLAMVGYTAKAKEMSIVNIGGDKKATMDLGALSTAFEVVANTAPKDVFDWNIPCTCPDNGVLRDDCARHSQMNKNIFDAFEVRENEVAEYMAGCGQRYGMPCTCGPNCRCKNCSEHCKESQQELQDKGVSSQGPGIGQMVPQAMHQQMPPPVALHGQMEMGGQGMNNIPGQRDGFQMAPRNPSILVEPLISSRNQSMVSDALRSNSIVSLGQTYGRNFSMTSETTFGRAMSGLSALSIDWENMDDFDVNVDHSAHITGDNDKTDGIAQGCAMMQGGECNCGPSCVCAGCPLHDNHTAPPAPQYKGSAAGRRSSLRKNIPVDPDGSPMQVSFKV